jgi:hypothetical protein
VILDTNALSAVADDEPAVVRVMPGFEQHSRRLVALSPQTISGSLHSAGNTVYHS